MHSALIKSRSLLTRSTTRVVVLIGIMASTQVAWSDHVEDRELRLAAASIRLLDIEAGAGSLDIVGDDAATDVIVTASIIVPRDDPDAARRIIESDLELVLEEIGDRARLVARFESGMFQWGSSPRIDVSVVVPARLALEVNDGSGSMTIREVRGDLHVDDGSGSLEIAGAGGLVDVSDGSGSLSIAGVAGDVRIVDGSGSIDVSDVQGSVTVNDGSGSIDVSDITADLIIEDDGSGGLRTNRIGGRVVRND